MADAFCCRSFLFSVNMAQQNRQAKKPAGFAFSTRPLRLCRSEKKKHRQRSGKQMFVTGHCEYDRNTITFPTCRNYRIQRKYRDKNKVKKENAKMAERKYGPEFGFQTRAVHTGNDVDKDTGAIKRPITLGNCYELPYDPSSLNWSSADKALYTRNGGVNQKYLQEKIASLEGAEDCVVLASGVAALSGVFFSFLKSGDHVVCSKVTYIAVYRLLTEHLKNKYGIEATLVDTSDPEAVRAAIRPNTKLIHIETPGNPTIGIADIAAIAAIAHENGILLSVDNTFASPFLQRPGRAGSRPHGGKPDQIHQRPRRRPGRFRFRQERADR
jgi:hypothetical protein